MNGSVAPTRFLIIESAVPPSTYLREELHQTITTIRRALRVADLHAIKRLHLYVPRINICNQEVAYESVNRSH
jgi:hypothetical protein